MTYRDWETGIVGGAGEFVDWLKGVEKFKGV